MNAERNVTGFRRLHPIVFTDVRQVLDLMRIGTRQMRPGEEVQWTDDEMAGEFGAPRATMRTVLQHLAAENRLDRRRRKGTTMPMHPEIVPGHPAATDAYTHRMHVHDNVACQALGDMFDADPEAVVTRIDGDVDVRGALSGRFTAYLQPPAGPRGAAALTSAHADAERGGVHAGILEKLGGPEAIDVVTTIEAVACEESLATYLDVPEGIPLLWRQTDFLRDGRVVATVVENVRNDRVVFEVRASRSIGSTPNSPTPNRFTPIPASPAPTTPTPASPTPTTAAEITADPGDT